MSKPRIKGYVNRAEAAAIIGVDPSQVSRYVSAGQLRAVRIGWQLMFREQDAKRFRRRPRGNPQFLKNNSERA